MMPDLDKLSKDRRDWLEVFGNQWGVKHPQVEPLTAEEKQALADALNPWAKRHESHPVGSAISLKRPERFHRSKILADQAKTSTQVASAKLRVGEMFHKEAFSLIWPRLE